MGNKLMQARCHLLNERILTSNNQLDEARQAFDTAQRLYQEADLLCPICQQPMGMIAEGIQILTCTHIFHQRYRQNCLTTSFVYTIFFSVLRCIADLLQRWTHQAQPCPKCNQSVLFSRSYIALSCS